MNVPSLTISRVLSYFRGWLAPPVFDDEDKTLTARLIHTLLLCLLGATFIGGPIVIFVSAAPRIDTLMQAGGFVLFLALMIWLTHRGYTRWVSAGLCLFLLALIHGSALNNGGSNAPAVIGYALVVVIAGLLLGGRGAFVSASLCLGSFSFIIYLQSQGGLAFPSPSPIAQVVIHGVVIMMIVLCLSLANWISLEASLRARQSEQKFRLLAENAYDLIYRYRLAPTRGFEYVSPAAALITGYTPEEHYADPDLGFKLIHPDDRYLLEDAAQGKIRPDKPITLRWVRKDGAIIWTEQHNTPIFDDVGNLIALEGIARDITARKQTEELLRASEERIRYVLNNMVEGCQIISHDWRYLYVNDAVAIQGRHTPQELLGHTMLEMYPGIETTELFATLQHCMEDRVHHQMVNEFTYPDGSQGWFELSIQPVPEGIFILSNDITARKQAEELLRASEERYRDLVEVSPSAILVHSDGRLVFVNPAAIKLLGAAHSGQLIGKSLWEIIHPDYHQIARERNQKMAEGQQVSPQERKFIRLDGSAVDVEIIPTRLVYQNQPAVQVIAQDITERKQAEEARRAAHSQLQAHLAEIEELQIELREQAIRDPLTGLYNRRYLFEALAREVPRAVRAGYPISIILLDIDRFKTINDTFGHDAGDKTLQALAVQLQALARAEDIVCRYGGDEHLIVMHNTTADKAVERADQLRKAIARKRVPHAGKSFKFTSSFGVAVFPVHAPTIEGVISVADRALYQSKETGGNRVTLL